MDTQQIMGHFTPGTFKPPSLFDFLRLVENVNFEDWRCFECVFSVKKKILHYTEFVEI